MNTPQPSSNQPPYRQQFTSYQLWHKQARRYVGHTAPASVRIFMRNTEPGNNWRRFVLPIVFAVLGAILLWGSSVASQEYNLLTGPSGKVGTLPVVDTFTEKMTRGAANKPELRLVVQLDDGQTATVRGYSNKDVNALHVGDEVKVFYATGETPIARWAGDAAAPSNGASIGLLAFGIITVLGAISLALFYHGSVMPSYMTYALAELEAGRTPAVPIKATKYKLEF